ncbi:MAG: hypothetical protein K8S25_16475 [Alphaproteobacteria bacterium]|nr:hypothetical protein [Alphaproteobacteria bacterium]
MTAGIQLETLRPLLIAVGLFALVAGLSFAWAAVESARTNAATPPANAMAAAV